MTTTATTTPADIDHQKVGGIAALYLTLALLGAIPYFLVVVDYPRATTAADRVDLIVNHYSSMYAVYLLTYVAFGLAVGVLALTLWERLRPDAPAIVRIATAVGLLWAVVLVASGMVFTYGMTTVHDLASTEQANAVTTWRAVESVAMALGGAGGELLGGLWVLLVSAVVVRGDRLPRNLGWLGLVIGVIGIASVLPPLNDATVAFGLLQIVWFGWLGGVLLTTKATVPTAHSSTVDDRDTHLKETAR
ncbi:MAG: DUF4386 family protein [Acidimicrobiales bacterium]